MRKLTRTIIAAIALTLVTTMATDQRVSEAAPPLKVCLFPKRDVVPSPPPKQPPGTITTFEAGSMILPMDGCYARPTFMSDKDIKQVFGKTPAQMVCDPNAEADDGLIETYGLIFRLVRAGVIIHWPVSTAKNDFNDADFSIVSAAGSPVKKMNYTTGALSDRYAALNVIYYLGAPFIIDVADVPKARTIMAALPQFALVNLHVAQVQFQAEIFRSFTELPKLAILNTDELKDEFSGSQFQKTIDSTVAAKFEGAGSWWHVVTTDEVLADRLTKDGFDMLWVPPFNLSSKGKLNPRQTAIYTKIMAYIDTGKSALFQDGSIQPVEGSGKWTGTFTEKFTSPFDQHMFGGMVDNGISSVFDNGDASEDTYSDDYGDPASQFGGIVWTGVGGSKGDWRPRPDTGYQKGVRRQVISEHATNDCADEWVFASWRYKDNDVNKGRLYYLGGSHWRKVTSAGFRLLLNTVLVHAPTGPPPGSIFTGEVSRSAPIVATVATTEAHYQGSYDALVPPEPKTMYRNSGDDAVFTFPQITGHLRAVDTTNIGATDTKLVDLPAIFDAADHIPPANPSGCGVDFSGNCRTVFTNVSDVSPTRVILKTGNRALLKPLLGADLTTAELDTLISRLLAGREVGGVYVPKLGGIDRSTMAIIESSPLAGTQRPTMIYFGALDGMLHAVCADVVGVCTAKGKELWAFMPRNQLGLVRTNEQRIDGSPKVADVFGDFDGDGKSEFRTVMVFQTGSGDPTDPRSPPAVYALDVTQPENPKILWEVHTPAPLSRGVLDFGVGLGVAMGSVKTAGGLKHLTFVQTNNGGTGGSGWVVVALETVTGKPVWTQGKLYDNPRNGANPKVPTDAIPGGVTAFDYNGVQSLDTVLVPTIYGEVWAFQASDGVNQVGSVPVFSFADDFHPIGAPVSIYRDAGGQLRALIVSGGYASPGPLSWSPQNARQYGVSLVLKDGGVGFPVTNTKIAGNSALGFLIDLGLGNRAFSQAIIAGGEIFIVTDSTNVNSDAFGSDVNPTGLLRRYSASGSGSMISSITLTGGASSVDVVVGSGTVFSGGGRTVKKTTPAAFNATGSATELIFDAKKGRILWLTL